ncbi:MAG: tRNA lysidine(34) synthetase TilS [Bacteroidales bacterium]|nr:tRNA lysidine(34) synthetase TilS [Bacteroidales bacterium]
MMDGTSLRGAKHSGATRQSNLTQTETIQVGLLRSCLPRNDERLILALSGGIDSMVLVDLLLKAKVDFVLAHCNFHLRGEESDGDERFVRDYAERNGLKIYVKQFETEVYAKEHGLSIEMTARELRYAWFEELRQQLNYDYIAVAHHADDQLETFFINLLRGAGIRGLKGMQPVNGHIIRPLLDVSRDEIHQYAIENGIQWREDHTNAETQFLRNNIRHELLPVIDGISKEGRSAILKSINHLASENELYRELLQEKLASVTSLRAERSGARQPEGSPTEGRKSNLTQNGIDNSGWIASSFLLAMTGGEQLLFEWLRDYGFNSDQVHFIYEAMNGQPGTTFFSPTHRLTIERDGLELTPICEQTESSVELAYEQLSKDESFVLDKSSEVAQLDYDKLTFPLKLRKWQAGDRFHPLGMKGSKLLSDFFVDQKMTTRQKEECLVLTTANDEIVWVVGRRIDDRFKVTYKTKTILIARMM